ncbi:hypothetical protein [Alkaliflexus imshenetskii]|jgi:hypothetical protein|uniref:hypothetical protein n=1 Tax=Alkaliflexus imshenetskii TaxID=286730 RepID=UPI0004789D07|nr:hypothetical protein [Alkaliflexus imshenetskii]
MEKKNVKLGTGLDGIRFGMTRQEMKMQIGEPSEVEEFTPEDEEDGKSEAWHYDELELSATFDELDDWRLTSLAVSSPEYLFEGIDLIGLSQEEVLQQVELMELGELELDSVADENEVEQEVGSIAEVSLNLWFEEGLLTEIQWGPFWDEDEEAYIWPEK